MPTHKKKWKKCCIRLVLKPRLSMMNSALTDRVRLHSALYMQ